MVHAGELEWQASPTPHVWRKRLELSGRVQSCAPSDSIDEAVAQMRSNRIRRLVVVDGSRHVVGMLSLADVARHVASLIPTRREVALVLSELVLALSERRASSGSTERAAE